MMKPAPAIRDRESGTPRSPAMRTHRQPTSLAIRDRLKLKSPWYQAITDPLNNGGAKIPDAIGTATATSQMVFDTSVDINAQGVAGARIVCPYPNKQPITPEDGYGYNYQVTRADSTSGDPNWSNKYGVLDSGSPFPQNQTYLDFAQGCRIVSACIIGMPELSQVNNSGEMCAAVVPFQHIPNDQASYVNYVSRYDSSTIPLNRNKSLKASWYPAAVTDTEGYSRDYRDFIAPGVNEGFGSFPYWEMTVLLSGATPNSGKLRVRMIVNLEWIPTYNSFDVISSGPSPVDIEEEEFVCAEMQERFSVTGPVSDKQTSSAPTTAPVASGEQNDTGFGFFAEILRELGPHVLKLALA